ncbi:nucleoside-diphosphate sugar epimerase/dehydratase [Halomonas chromatireducens]|uniref:UDP-N-acetyl-alpha-D-glucosamine C6 dehydratase n=1 Tax=Halomonas chromatireducens TaxID=507626 RepID=A0A0X8HCF0_9GAMM|nr:nucleoside-diphosphate sugar epimerase/dehydratase [Halomonas chromatireducens]AMD00025.1 UDP-N-acetyl-alpha-D-glucosamine C6 dehydratase [Halomonas chromatireducens]
MAQLLKKLFSLPRRHKQTIQLLADSFLIVVSFFTAMLLRLDSTRFLTDPAVWMALPVVVPVSLIIFMRLGFYRAIIRYMGLKAFQAVMAGVMGSALTLGVVSTVFSLPVPRSVPFIYIMLALMTIGGVRLALRLLYQRGQQRLKTRVLIYGAGAAGRQLVMSLHHGRDYEPVGFVDYAPKLQGTHVQGLRVYAPDDTNRVINSYGVEKLLLAVPEATRSRRQDIIESLEPLSIPVQTIPDMADVISGKAKFNELRDVAVEDLLGRDPVPPDQTLMVANIAGKVVMVTGAGGSIGSELCRQILRQHPSKLLLVDASEFSLYRIENDLQRIAAAESIEVVFKPILASVQNGDRIKGLLDYFGVSTIYHAAAYKHVPMVEYNPGEGVLNNVFGTLAVAKAAIAAGVDDMVLISTDKAVRPTNVMGASKRMAELVCQSMAALQQKTRFSMVRFGNVLGSSGSVVPLFRKQIEMGGPITVTHPEITRYFMTIPEAAQLVIQAGGMARGGDVFVLDMGKPVRIVELATRMVRLTGLEPHFPQSNPSSPQVLRKGCPVGQGLAEGEKKGDISIIFTGLRPGEKLYEELLVTEAVGKTRHPRIMTANEASLSWEELEPILSSLHTACKNQDADSIRRVLMEAPTQYHPQSDVIDFEPQARSTDTTPSPGMSETVLSKGGKSPSQVEMSTNWQETSTSREEGGSSGKPVTASVAFYSPKGR